MGTATAKRKIVVRRRQLSDEYLRVMNLRSGGWIVIIPNHPGHNLYGFHTWETAKRFVWDTLNNYARFYTSQRVEDRCLCGGRWCYRYAPQGSH